MDPAHLLRTARRHLGLSQRDFAAAAGVAPGTLASWESGRRQPSVRALDEALQRVDLELTLARNAPADPDPALLRHLRRPVVARLRRAITEEAWHELELLARAARVQLGEPLASALWVPATVDEVRVVAHDPRRPLPATRTVRVEVSSSPLPAYVLPIYLGHGCRVWVAPPAAIALERAERLRAADRVLHEERGRDDGGRRPPAHRDPDERAEGYRVLQSAQRATFVRAARADGRGWRADAPVSLAQQLRAGGTLPW